MSKRRQAGRRIVAFGVDYLLIGLYIGLLALVGLMLVAPRLTLSQPWQTQILGFITLTLPVVLYFALNESLAGGTFGKRLLGLRVTDASGEPLLLSRSLLRSALKFTPWELAHTAVHRLVFWTADDAALSSGQWTFLVTFYVLSLGLAVSYVVGLFRGQPLYDRLAHSRVALATVHSRRFS